MFILRLFAVAFLIVATIAGGSDIVEWYRTGARASITVGQLWTVLHVQSLTAIHAILQRDFHPALWDPMMVWVLRKAAWVAFGVPGFVMLWCDIWLTLRQGRAPKTRRRFRAAA
jgi:hypothetical protein